MLQYSTRWHLSYKFCAFCGKKSLITPRRTRRLYIFIFFSFVIFVVKIKPIFFDSGLSGLDL